MELQYLGHSGFKISFSSANVLIDPFLGDSPQQEKEFQRRHRSPLSKSQLKDIALILITHEHFDHFDKEVIEHIAGRDKALVVSHESTLQQLSLPRGLLRPIAVNAKESLRGIEINALPAHHPQAFYPLSFLLKGDNATVFHAGDTDLMESFAEINTDIALLPIGGTFTMDIIDAVRAVKTMKPKVAIPMHYNTFSIIKADAAEFKQRIEKSVLKTRPVVLQPGESFVYK